MRFWLKSHNGESSTTDWCACNADGNCARDIVETVWHFRNQNSPAKVWVRTQTIGFLSLISDYVNIMGFGCGTLFMETEVNCSLSREPCTAFPIGRLYLVVSIRFTGRTRCIKLVSKFISCRLQA